MRHTPARTPFDVKLSPQAEEELTAWLAMELDNALIGRDAQLAENRYVHTLYEQGRTRNTGQTPWPDAADLTSPIPTEKVDALRSRLIRTIFVEPIWTVEGWGDAATRAPFVEEFHQWQAETEGFQRVFSAAIHLSLLEPCGVIELYEETIRRPVRRIIRGQLEIDPTTGAVIFDERMQPIFRRQPDGAIQEAQPALPNQPEAPSAEVAIDDFEVVARGPRGRIVPYENFLQLPADALTKQDLWGYAKRFWRRLDELEERVGAGIYAQERLDELGTEDERQGDRDVPAEGPLAEKELWEVTFLKQLDRTGLRWYVATIHKDKRILLRLQHDDIGRPRYFTVIPFPRATGVEGYGFVAHKLITVTEENTAWRNMLADRAAMEVQAPLKRKHGALWDPDDEPIGPKSVITVREMDEVQPLQMPQMTAPARERILDTERQAEKLAGLSDIASGTNPNVDRTLGETQLIQSASDVRVEEVLRNLQETLEEIAQVRHLMWIRALESLPDGLEVPNQMLQGLETRGVDVTEYLPNKRATADLLRGAFRFKPRGSVESADRGRNRRDFAESMRALAELSRANQMIGAVLQQGRVAKALLERWVYLYGITDKQAFLGSEAMRVFMAPPMPLGMPPPPGPPGMPPGGPPGLQRSSGPPGMMPGGPGTPPGMVAPPPGI